MKTDNLSNYNLNQFNLSEAEFNKISAKNQNNLLFKTIIADTLTPVLAMMKINHLAKYQDYHFLFESAEKGVSKSRFSAIGVLPDLIWKCENSKSYFCNYQQNQSSKDQNFQLQEGNPIENLRQLINSSKIDWSNLSYISSQLPSICAGIFGFMGYDMVNFIEKISSQNQIDETQIPDAVFIRPQILIVFDNLFDQAIICAANYKNENFADLSKKILEIEEILTANFLVLAAKKNQQNIEEKKSAKEIKETLNFSAKTNKEEYLKMVLQSKKYIDEGDIFQVLPSQRFVCEINQEFSAFDFYRSLRSVNPSPFLFYLKLDDFSLVGSSPEIMVSVKDKKMTIRPLAGTRKRGKNFEEDKKIAAELLSDEKELAEHLMLIDLGRHDVGKVCLAGSVNVTEKMIIENYSHVMHISSNVEGILDEKKYDALDALLSGFPAGTVSGAPKIRAMQIIAEIEKIKRSFYSGCVGYFSSNSDMETCITLRSALIKNNKIYLHAGAGVVADSDPESEYQECFNKTAGLIKAIENIERFKK
jgi:anthranilate synthase component 1